MKLQTRHFGEIEVDEAGIVSFEESLPGFENVKKFVLLYQGEDSPFVWLQSIDETNLAFAMIDPFSIVKDYDINISQEALKKIDLKDQKDLLIYSIVVVPEDISKLSMNLKAPVIINSKTNKGMQVILDTDRYTVRHYILDELRRQEVVENASTDKKEGAVNSNK